MTHEHGPDSHVHEGLSFEEAYAVQPLAMGIKSALVPMQDGTDRIMVTFFGANGQWTVFFEREHAIEHASMLLRMAHVPPVIPEVTPEAVPESV